MAVPTFIADVHLGKLARELRLLGFDTLYSNTFSPADLVTLAAAEGRMLLSRSAAFLLQPTITALQIQSEVAEAQLGEVVNHFQLKEAIRPFTRCLVCNGLLQPVPKTEIDARLPPNTKAFYSEFWQCASCHRIYWKGAHYKRMQTLVQTIIES